jgi:SNF family Na+-dependent transporter
LGFIGALLTSVLVGWRLSAAFTISELEETSPRVGNACHWLLRFLCPVAILAVFVASLV